MTNYLIEYNNKIQSGEIVTSRRVKQIYARLADDIAHSDQYLFDEVKANKPIEFIETFCKQSKGEWAGKPIKLMLFQKAFISALFGFINKTGDKAGYRRFREAFLYCARKNGKSTIMSGIALYMLMIDEAGSDCFCAANKLQQAKLIFDECLHMVEQSPQLGALLKKRKSDLYFAKRFSKLQPLSKNSNTADGLNAQLILLDEAHSITDKNLYEVLKQSQSARKQPLFITTTTAGTVRESVFDDMYKYAVSIAEGTFTDDTFLPVLYELDDKLEYKEPDKWIKANPALGEVKQLSDLKEKTSRVKGKPSDLIGLLVKDFNVIQNSAKTWLLYEDINNRATFDIADFRGWYGVAGVDLSKAGDLTSATLLLLGQNDIKYCYQMYWLPAEGFSKRVEEDKIPYDKWLEAGLLRLCEGNTINTDDVLRWFKDIVNNLGITPIDVYYDSWHAKFWAKDMQSEGFTMTPCRQGAYTLSMPLELLEADIKAKRINFNNNPLLKFCLSNCSITEDRNGNRLLVKACKNKYKIDGAASLLDAYVALLNHYQELKDLL